MLDCEYLLFRANALLHRNLRQSYCIPVGSMHTLPNRGNMIAELS